MKPDDQSYMREALRLAAKGWGRTSPNPMVGAVVVRQGAIVGRGYHQYVGGPHAEVNALRDAGENANGATLYVTLEPCNHHGRTPPCTLAILKAGISRVVIGMSDPNADVKGGGAALLREHDITVDAGVLEENCRLLNQAFIKYVTKRVPYVTLKAAMTLDGRIASRTGDSRWISNERSRRFGHGLRCALDAILVGVGTVLSDDPMLTARMTKRGKCRQPTRVVVDTNLAIPLGSQLIRTARDVPVLIACSEHADSTKADLLKNAGAELIRLPEVNGRVDLIRLLQELGKREMSSLLVEGGARILAGFLEEHLADSFYFFYAPKILADPESLPAFVGKSREKISEALKVYAVQVKSFGQDVMIFGRLNEEIY